MRPPAIRLLAVAAVMHVAVLSAGPEDRQRLEWSIDVHPIDSPAAEHSAQPQLTVSSRGVLLSWIERSDSRASLKFAERTPTGWSAPRTAASGDDWFVNWADVPSVRRLAGGTLVAHWLQKTAPDTYAYDVRLAYSNDDGQTWSASFTPHHDGTKTEHGFASLFEMPDGGLGIVWLDGRAMASAGGHGVHGSSAGAMSLRAATFDQSWKLTSERPIDLRVCECCPTAAAVTSEGPVVAFRNRTEDEVRDIYVSRLRSGRWTAPEPVHDDGWRIHACPVNGPMLSARGQNVAIAWFTLEDDAGRAYAAFSSDAGRSFGTPIRLDTTSTLGRVDIELLPDGSAAATWIELANERATFSVRRVHPSGRTSAPISVSNIAGSRASGYPRIARSGDELVFAWTESSAGTSRVRTAAARLRSP